MKYVESQILSEYTCILDKHDAGSTWVYGKLELYSCDKNDDDFELGKELEQRLKKETNHNSHVSTLSSSPHNRAKKISTNNTGVVNTSNGSYKSPGNTSYLSNMAASPFGNIRSPTNRSIFCDLIATLNEVFPDCDFSDAKPSDFTKEQMEHVFNTVNLSLREVFNLEQRNKFWMNLEAVISFGECEIFSYIPNEDEDPLALGEGKIWSWNYLFYNKKQKKVLFFTCHAKSKFSFKDPYSSMSDNDSDYESMYSNPKNADVHYYPRDDSYDDMDFDDL